MAKIYVNGILQDANEVWTWEELRVMRNTLLKMTDKYMITDRFATYTEEQQQELLNYRQTLRDLPQTYSDMNELEFPDEILWLD